MLLPYLSLSPPFFLPLSAISLLSFSYLLSPPLSLRVVASCLSVRLSVPSTSALSTSSQSGQGELTMGQQNQIDKNTRALQQLSEEVEAMEEDIRWAAWTENAIVKQIMLLTDITAHSMQSYLTGIIYIRIS